jgi:hypothetical protein
MAVECMYNQTCEKWPTTLKTKHGLYWQEIYFEVILLILINELLLKGGLYLQECLYSEVALLHKYDCTCHYNHKYKKIVIASYDI